MRSRSAPSVTLSDHDFFGEHGCAAANSLLIDAGRRSGDEAAPHGLSAVCMSYCNLMLLDHATFERVLARAQFGAMSKKFLKMSGADAVVKRNKRLHSVVNTVFERERDMRGSCMRDSRLSGGTHVGSSGAVPRDGGGGVALVSEAALSRLEAAEGRASPAPPIMPISEAVRESSAEGALGEEEPPGDVKSRQVPMPPEVEGATPQSPAGEVIAATSRCISSLSEATRRSLHTITLGALGDSGGRSSPAGASCAAP